MGRGSGCRTGTTSSIAVRRRSSRTPRAGLDRDHGVTVPHTFIEAPTTVLFIGGEGRSGSTLLDRMLGQLPGFFSTGELREVWNRGLIENLDCGCGLSFRSCSFWTAVGDE